MVDINEIVRGTEACGEWHGHSALGRELHKSANSINKVQRLKLHIPKR